MKFTGTFLSLLFLAVTAAHAQEYTPADLARRAVERRAVEAALWGMPAVNTELMLQEMLGKTEGKVNQVIYWGRALDWHNQTLTPNPDAIYFMTFIDTREVGPVVLEIPAGDSNGSLTGNLVTTWQASLEDVGLLGIDKGAGGKFVILPPGYAEKLPEGYIPLPSDTNLSYALLRANLKSHKEADVAATIAYGKRVRVYPLSAASSPPATVFTDAKDVIYDSTIRYDASFFQSLDQVIQREPWIERDRVMIDQLRTIGIEKGKPFAPDAATQETLGEAIKEAKALLEARYEEFFPPFFPGSNWALPALPETVKGQSTNYADHGQYAVFERGLTYTLAYISIKHMGTAQFYLMTIKDKTGQPYDGAKTYKLTVPPNPPVEQYWSVTVYDRETHGLVKGMAYPSRSSQIPEMQKHEDGSIDVYFGPKAPEGKETNWVPTDPNRRFELMFRAYAPKKEFFEKEWKLPDVEEVK